MNMLGAKAHKNVVTWVDTSGFLTMMKLANL